ALRQPRRGEVEPVDGEVVGVDAVDEAGVEVDRPDGPGGPDPPAQPPGDRSTTGADLEAAPPRPDADGLEVADRPGVVDQLQRLQPGPGVLPGVVELIVAGRGQCRH